MPQLMPLGWVFSVFMVLVLMIMALILYCKGGDVVEVESMMSFEMDLYWLW